MMSPVIRLDDEVFNGLKKLAEPFEDTPNSVIRRWLEEKGVLTKRRTASSTDRSNPSRTPQEFFRLPILQVIEEIGGSGRTKDVLNKLGEKIKDQLTAHDFSKTSTGGIRWRVYARWQGVQMRKEELLSGPRGHWTITANGRALLKNTSNQQS